MFDKMKKVLTVYTSGWTFWLVTGVAMMFFVGIPLTEQRVRHSNVLPQPSAWTFSVVRSDYLTPVVKAKQKSDAAIEVNENRTKQSRVQRLIKSYSLSERKEIDWKKFDMSADGVRVHSNADYSKWERFERMKNLEFLDMKYSSLIENRNYSDSEITELHEFGLSITSDLKKLKNYPKLKSFRSPRGNYKKKDLEYLDSIAKLRWLDISSSELKDGLESIPILDNLEILQIANTSQLSEAAVLHLNDFPKLKTLYVTTFDVSQSGVQLMEKAIALQSQTICGLTNIETIYLPHMMVYGYSAKPITAPQMTVYPSSVNSTRINSTIFMLFLLIVLSFSIGSVLTCQFSRPESKLTPHYFSPHCYVAAVFLAIAILGASISMITVDVDPFSAIAICLVATSPIIFLNLPKRINNGYLTFIVLFSLLQIMVLGLFSSVMFERFLIGLHPRVTVLLGLAGLCITVIALRRMDSVHDIFIEKGLPTPIMGLSDINRLKIQQMGAPENAVQSWIMKLNFPVEAQFKKTASSPAINSDEKFFRIWKIASGKTSRWIMNFAAFLLLLIQGSWYFQHWLNDTSPSFSRPMYFQTWIVTLMITGYCGALACSGWWQRMPMLARESCLPITRNKMISNIHRGVLVDIIWIPFLLTLFGSPSILVTHSLSQSLLWITIYFMSSFAAASIIFGAVLYSLSLTKSWHKVLLGVIVGVLLILIVIAVPTLIDTDILASKGIEQTSFRDIQTTLLGTGLVFFSIGAILIYFAKTRWSKLEFAKLV